MKKINGKIKENLIIAPNTMSMVIELPGEYKISPGQFVNIDIPGKFLRRPISVCDYRMLDISNKSELKIIYKVVGKGTEILAELPPESELDILVELGNGYDINSSGNHPILIGGGVGVPPLYYLARNLVEAGVIPTIILGFNTGSDVILKDDFLSLGCEVKVVTMDGSRGLKGVVTDFIKGEYSYYYTCGPEPMLKAVYKELNASGELSFETRMGCGFGACMGCSCITKSGEKRLCKEGPVIKKEEVAFWED